MLEAFANGEPATALSGASASFFFKRKYARETWGSLRPHLHPQFGAPTPRGETPPAPQQPLFTS